MKFTYGKSIMAVLALLLLVCALFFGCSRTTGVESTEDSAVDITSGDAVSLRIVTEKTGNFQMNDLVEDLIAAFQESHTDVIIDLEILPTDTEEREIRLEGLRAEILAGKGPDIYLMPTEPDGSVMDWKEELLFQDVKQSMYNELYADISTFYNTDKDLGTEELQTAIMDAGTIGEARYVLPLWYNISTLLINPEVLQTYGLSEMDVAGSVDQLYEVVIQKNDPKLTFSSSLPTQYESSMIPELINYDTEEILVRADDLENRLHEFQQINYLEATEEEEYIQNAYACDTQAYMASNRFWNDGDHPLFVGTLTDALKSQIVGTAAGKADYLAYPLRSSDGSVVAEITYWGAIDANCENVELAYAFLRQFLSREVQWETTRSELDIDQSGSLYAEGYPVRVEGSVAHISKSLISMASKRDLSYAEGANERLLALKAVELTDEDFPLLDVEINDVRFPIAWEREVQSALIQLLPTFSQPGEIDIEKTAGEMIRELEFHLAEG